MLAFYIKRTALTNCESCIRNSETLMSFNPHTHWQVVAYSVVVSTLALFNEVNWHWARLVLRWVNCLRTGKPSVYVA